MKLFTNSHAIIKGLEKINITTSEEVLDHLPYRYEDNSYTDLSYLEDNQSITVYGRLVSNPTKFSNGKFSVIRFFFVTENNSFFKVTMYNRPYVHNTINLGDFYTIIGTYKAKDKEIVVKSFLQNKIPSDKSIRGVYHLPSEITPTTYRKFISNTYDKMVNYIIDDMPSIFKNKYRLLDKKEAYKYVHFPSNEEELKKGLRTLKYHECLAFSLKNQIIRGENKSIPNEDKKLIDTKKINEFVKNLTYKLTADQIKAIREIILDMNQKSYMYRLLQGDVGTGKTIVAMSALYGNYIRGNIGVFMAPTDSLARQQYKELEDIFKPYGIKVGMLIGGLTVKEKKVITTKLLDGEIDVLVGTHAVFSDNVAYPNIGLVVIDEQHRFGVEQRNKLIRKDDGCDLLLMSATPIPRTLALTLHGDLDITILSEFPNKERNIVTKIKKPTSYEIINLIKDCLEEKRQVFIVAPKITENENDLASAESLYSAYEALFPNQVSLLHGKMKSKEKDEILNGFINGEKLILVSTTVIELGINVMNAGAIIIYSSSNFGLASLHQLRGRVGRNGNNATCLLIDDDVENTRLKVLEQSLDGFYIAEQDLKMRGPGDVVGTSQSGFPVFASLNILEDFKMFECARDDALYILKHLHVPEINNYFRNIKMKIENEKIKIFD